MCRDQQRDLQQDDSFKRTLFSIAQNLCVKFNENISHYSFIS